MKPPIPGPTSFTGAPSIHPQRQAARVVEVPPDFKRTHQTEPLVTVRLPNRVELNREALRHANLGPGSLVELKARRRGASDCWLLDTRPFGTCKLTTSAGGYNCFTLPAPLSPSLFPPGQTHRKFLLGPERTTNVCVTTPEGRQVCEVRGTGVYELVPK